MGRVDWAEKQALLERMQEEERATRHKRQAELRRHNYAIQEALKSGVTCPHCAEKKNFRIVEKSPEGRSYIICRSCARSFGA